MARIHDDDIRRLKESVSIEALCRSRGIELKPHGARDLVGRCPFHDEDEPSFVVTPVKNLFHCLGCDAAGSVIDLVMKLDGLDFRQAVDQLLEAHPSLCRASDLPRKDKIDVPPEKAAQLLERVVELYAKTFGEVDDGRKYLEGRGIADAGLFTQHRIGYANGTLKNILPRNGQLKEELKALGILLDGGKERFEGCVVFPVFDGEGQLVTICGRHVKTRKHVFLPDRSKGLWNEAAAKTYPDLILVESVIDALSLMVAGHPNVIALHGTNPSADALDRLNAYGIQRVTLLLDGDAAGQAAAGRLKERLSCACTIKVLPDGQDPNSFLTAHGAERLHDFLAEESGSVPGEVRAMAPEAARTPTLTLGRRRYGIHGLEKGTRKLKATVRVEHAGRLHVDTLDLYSARSRRTLAQDLCRIFEETPETIEADITKLLKHCENLPEGGHAETENPNPEPTLTPRERDEAEAFGKSVDLVKGSVL